MPPGKSGTVFAGKILDPPPSARRKIFCPGNTLIVCARLACGHVEEAWSSGRMMRNMDLLLQGELDEQSRPCFAQRANGLCNAGHKLAAVRALENLAGITPPRNACLARSLVQALRCIQEHLLHFYQFHLSNWTCLAPALRADPCKTARLAENSGRATGYFRQCQQRLQPLAQGKGINGLGLRDHEDYCGSNEFHLLVFSHSLESLQTQALLNRALGLMGYENGRCNAYHMGGLPEDLNLGGKVLQHLRDLLLQCRDFVCSVFLKDLEQVARTYGHWKDLAKGNTFLALGDFGRPRDSEGQLFPAGIICLEGVTPKIDPVQTGRIRDDKNPQWNRLDQGHYRLDFGDHGPGFHWGKGDFHWLTAPRHGSHPCEAGPLARVAGAFAHGQKAVHQAVNDSLAASGLEPEDLNSALGRLLARGIESSVLAQTTLAWLEELETSLSPGESRMGEEVRLPAAGIGIGHVEVPRGALTHTIQVEKNRIIRHDYLIPSLWNFSPRDSNQVRGPLEQALLGTPVTDPDHPLEILRIVHAFDPCNPCHVVVEDMDSGKTTVVDGE